MVYFPDEADDYQQQTAENSPKKRVTFSEHVRARIYIAQIHRDPRSKKEQTQRSSQLQVELKTTPILKFRTMTKKQR